MKGFSDCFTLLEVPKNVDFDVFKAPERGFADQSVKLFQNFPLFTLFEIPRNKLDKLFSQIQYFSPFCDELLKIAPSQSHFVAIFFASDARRTNPENIKFEQNPRKEYV